MAGSNSGNFHLSFDSVDDYARARELLSRAGYDVQGIQQRLGVAGSIAPNSDALVVRRTVGGDALDVLLRLFLAGRDVAASDAERALKPMDLNTWVRAGLLVLTDGQVAARVKLLPADEWVVAFDRRERGKTYSQDMVLGIGNATMTLISMTARRQVQRTLDLGTGCGIQAFFASRHSEQVVALDSNPRAIRFAVFNSQLNGISNIECIEGDRFDPVKDRTFDSVLCNAPFVISPSSGYVSLDGGMQGDRFCRSVALEVPSHLNEGGMCQMLCNWAHFAGQDWEQYLAGWFDARGCDIWVIRSRKDDAASYARLWIQEIYGEDSQEFDARYHEWMDYYEREGIEAMSMGLVNIRRTDDRPTRIRIDDAPEMVMANGDDILRLMERRDVLRTMNDESLLESCLKASPELRLDRQHQTTDGRWEVVSSRLFISRGFAYSVSTDEILAEFVAQCKGDRTVRAVIEDVGGRLGVNLSASIPECLKIIRRCVDLGFFSF